MAALQGKVTLITGASRGIGKGLAERLGAAGANLVLTARSLSAPKADHLPGTLEETVALIEQRGGTALAVQCDIEDAASREAMVEQVLDRFGRVDILVNNAGSAIYKRIDEMPYDDAVRQVQQFFLGPWDLCSRLIPVMRELGEGRILNIGSISCEPPEGPPYSEGPRNNRARRGAEATYAALKTAMHRFSQGLACDYYDDNIAVNVLAPVGAIWTPTLASLGTLQNLPKERFDEIVEPIEHIAEAAVDILSREPQSFTGQVVFSHHYLDSVGRPTMSLDGRAIHTLREPVAA